MKRILLMSMLLAAPRAALAGGFEFAGNGTQALGRGAAFAAKADDPTAMDYNVAGLARQRGTQLLIDSNLSFHTYEFTRAGTYPGDPTDPATPFAGQAYPRISNQAAPFLAPFLGVTTDFNYFERWTFGLGVFGPSSVGIREYPVTLANNLPAPQRYDVRRADLLVIYPTLAVGFRALPWLDVGAELQLVWGRFDLGNVSYFDLGPTYCKSAEYPGCDTTTKVLTDGWTATAQAGFLMRPLRWLQFGARVRGPIDIKSDGTVDATSPKAFQVDIKREKATFEARLPWVVRAGVRYIWQEGNFERADVEVDGDWQNWGANSGSDAYIKIPHIAVYNDVNPVVVHHFNDVFSLRVGGAYSFHLPMGPLSSVVTVRAGFMYETASTDDLYTRLDFDTMAKYIGTIGIGSRLRRGITLKAAYAYVYEADRDVSNGNIRQINATTGKFVGSDGMPTRAVNNGHYHAATQVLSLGFTIAWEELLGKKPRVLTYGE